VDAQFTGSQQAYEHNAHEIKSLCLANYIGIIFLQ